MIPAVAVNACGRVPPPPAAIPSSHPSLPPARAHPPPSAPRTSFFHPLSLAAAGRRRRPSPPPVGCGCPSAVASCSPAPPRAAAKRLSPLDASYSPHAGNPAAAASNGKPPPPPAPASRSSTGHPQTCRPTRSLRPLSSPSQRGARAPRSLSLPTQSAWFIFTQIDAPFDYP